MGPDLSTGPLDARYRQLGLDVTFEEDVAANEEKIASGLCRDAPA